jgi:hypothetical protein
VTLYKVNFFGTFSGGEEWNTGHWIYSFAEQSASSIASTVVDSYSSSSWDIEGGLHTGDSVTGVRVYRYSAPNTAANDQAEELLNVAGKATGSQCLPSTTCMVVTLRTGAPGRSRRGRMYIPARNVLLAGANGQMASGQPAGLAGAVADYFGSLNVILERQVVVVSRTNATWAPIKSVDVGTVFDTQRRRRADLTETRTSVDVSQV